MIRKMTDEEINTLAEDIYRGRVFTTDHLKQGDLDMLPSIFMPLVFVFADKKLREELLTDAPGMIYEHFSAAGRLSINGYPTFFSLHIVSQEDAKKVWEKFERIKNAVCEATKHDSIKM